MTDKTIKMMSAFISKGSVVFNEPLDRHSTIGVGGTAAIWYKPASTEELSKVYRNLKKEGERVITIGRGSNTLMPDGIFDAVVIDLSDDRFMCIDFDGSRIKAAAGVKLSVLIAQCLKRGFAGMEGLVGIPGTVGGALFVNAAYRSRISDCLLTVDLLDDHGEIKQVKREDLVFGYRRSSFKENDIILDAVFGLKEMAPDILKRDIKSYFLEKIRTQPLGERTLGCIFKNPEGIGLTSAELIDQAGLKGRRSGDAVVSEKHANFIVNTGNATQKDVLDLMGMITSVVKKRFNVDLEPEIRIVD